MHGQGGQTCRQGPQREGEWEGRQAREGAQGSGTRVTRRRAEVTRRARGSSKEREHRTKKKTTAGRADTQEGHKERQGAGGGGHRGPTGVQRNTSSLSEKHHATDPHGAVPAAPPDHQGTDGGAAGGRGRRGSPPEGVSGEAAQVGLQVGRRGGGHEAREGARDTALARRRPAASTRSRGTTLRGRAGDRGEGRVERGESGYMYRNAGGMAGSPGMAGDCQGERHRMAERLDVSTEQKRDGDAVLLCVHAERREPSEKKKEKKKAEKKRRGKQTRTTPRGGGTKKDEWLGPRDGPR